MSAPCTTGTTSAVVGRDGDADVDAAPRDDRRRRATTRSRADGGASASAQSFTSRSVMLTRSPPGLRARGVAPALRAATRRRRGERTKCGTSCHARVVRSAIDAPDASRPRTRRRWSPRGAAARATRCPRRRPRRSGPVPVSASRSMPRACASRRAFGDASRRRVRAGRAAGSRGDGATASTCADAAAAASRRAAISPAASTTRDHRRRRGPRRRRRRGRPRACRRRAPRSRRSPCRSRPRAAARPSRRRRRPA